MWYICWLLILRSMEIQYKSFRLILAPLSIYYGGKEQWFDFFLKYEKHWKIHFICSCLCALEYLINRCFNFLNIGIHNTLMSKTEIKVIKGARMWNLSPPFQSWDVYIPILLECRVSLTGYEAVSFYRNPELWWINPILINDNPLTCCKERCSMISFHSLWLELYTEILPSLKVKRCWKNYFHHLRKNIYIPKPSQKLSHLGF